MAFYHAPPSWDLKLELSERAQIWSSHEGEMNTLFGRFSGKMLHGADAMPSGPGFTTIHSERIDIVYKIGDQDNPFLLRPQLGCLLGSVFHLDDCDCRLQMNEALKAIAAHGAGAFIYFRDREGQGVGFNDKMKLVAYERETGKNVFDAAKDLNITLDPYSCLKWVPPIVHHVLDVEGPITLLTGNQERARVLKDFGLHGIAGCQPLAIDESRLSAAAREEISVKRIRYGQHNEL